MPYAAIEDRASGSASHSYLPEITDTLRSICGEIASSIALQHPAPHSAFLNQPKQVMHLIAMAISINATFNHDQFLYQNWRNQIKTILPDCWHGHSKTLSKIPLPLLTQKQYAKLYELLNCPAAKKYLQHISIITGNIVDILHELPATLRVRTVSRFIETPLEARLIASLCRDEDVARSFLDRVRTTDNRSKFWDDDTTHLIVKAFTFPKGPSIDDHRIHQITKPTDLLKAASKFQNCLKRYISDGIDGEFIFYRFTGHEPAIISLRTNFCGLPTISEIAGIANSKPSDATYAEIVDAFQKHGISNSSEDVYEGLYDKLTRSLFILGRRNHTKDSIEKECLSALNLIDQINQPSTKEV